MRLGSWNIRGCNDPLKLQEVIDFIGSNKVDVFGILETRIKERKATKFSKKFSKFRVMHNCSVSNGRIWVVWDPRSVTVTNLDVQNQYIHCQVQHHESGAPFQVTFVYAYNDAHIREELWSSLVRLSGLVQNWVVLGDFNVVRDVQERISESAPVLSDILAFNACLLRSGLDDLKAFPSSSANYLPSGVSDHSPCLVTIFEDKRKPTRFSFLNCWIEDPGYLTVVQNAWNIPVRGNAMFQFFAKLKNVRASLTHLHRDKFSSIQLRILEAKRMLDTCQLALQ
ncbi:hypothetical protein RND81_04G054500 [Saponaria officinalis]|uniref:Endonuclease/exonuclease/phosphatase domain-containing protein n=1 Tax=Saponaria officinalis TaxID=3572 RepID=A0AAW1LL65_SAPOF